MAFPCSHRSPTAAGRTLHLPRDGSNSLVRVAFILVLIAVFPRPGLLHAASLSAKGNPQLSENKRLNVTIIARGSSVRSSTGNMDIYLAVISNGRHGEPVAARLVYYYPFFARALSEERMNSGLPFHLRLSHAAYCGMEAKDFVTHQVFDEDALSKLRGDDGHAPLPCYLIHQ